MSKYKIYKVKDGFSVWKLKDFGSGYAWESMKKHFRTKEEARKFIEEEREGSKK